MAHARCCHEAVHHGEKILAIGGISSGKTAEEYDIRKDKWRPLPDLPISVENVRAVLVGDTALVVFDPTYGTHPNLSFGAMVFLGICSLAAYLLFRTGPKR